jgi:dUTP pyrophosphatase
MDDGRPLHPGPVNLSKDKPTVRFALTSEAKAAGLPLPERAHPTDAGFDLRAHHLQAPIRIQQGSVMHTVEPVNTGIRVAVPPGWCGIIRERSSWARVGLRIFGGVIDASYRGEITVLCYGFSEAEALINKDDYPRFAQLLIVPVWSGAVEYADDLGETERGEMGFGSTGQG